MKALYGYIAAGALVLSGITGVTGYMYGIKAEKGNAAREELKLAAVEERAAVGAAKEIAKIKVRNVTNNQLLEREIINNPVPAGCVLTDAGLSALNAIIEGTAVAASDRELPGAEPSR